MRCTRSRSRLNSASPPTRIRRGDNSLLGADGDLELTVPGSSVESHSSKFAMMPSEARRIASSSTFENGIVFHWDIRSHSMSLNAQQTLTFPTPSLPTLRQNYYTKVYYSVKYLESGPAPTCCGCESRQTPYVRRKLSNLHKSSSPATTKCGGCGAKIVYKLCRIWTLGIWRKIQIV